MFHLKIQMDCAFIFLAWLALTAYEETVLNAQWALVVDGAGALVVAMFASFFVEARFRSFL